VELEPYSVTVLDGAGSTVNVIQKWKRITRPDDNARTPFSVPLDLKFSFLTVNPHGKTRQEFYVAVENVLSLLYAPQGNTTFNPYTGNDDTGSVGASYDIPVPVPSFGFRWSY
jgi:hypothetical protein